MEIEACALPIEFAGGGLSASNLPAFELSRQMAGKAETSEEDVERPCRQRHGSGTRFDWDNEQQDIQTSRCSRQIHARWSSRLPWDQRLNFECASQLCVLVSG